MRLSVIPAGVSAYLFLSITRKMWGKTSASMEEAASFAAARSLFPILLRTSDNILAKSPICSRKAFNSPLVVDANDSVVALVAAIGK